MTREEAIESFEYSNKQAKLRLEVEKMRMDSGEIKELEFYIERDDMAIKALEQEPCEDAISRQATLDAIIKRLGIKNEAYLLEAERTIYQQILAMPPVTPQPKIDAPIKQVEDMYDSYEKSLWREREDIRGDDMVLLSDAISLLQEELSLLGCWDDDEVQNE